MKKKDLEQYKEIMCLASEIMTLISRHDELADDLRTRIDVPCKRFKDKTVYVQKEPLILKLST